MPMTQVCRELGVCATALKRVCRALGIVRWPYRQKAKAERAGARGASTCTNSVKDSKTAPGSFVTNNAGQGQDTRRSFDIEPRGVLPAAKIAAQQPQQIQQAMNLNPVHGNNNQGMIGVVATNMCADPHNLYSSSNLMEMKLVCGDNNQGLFGVACTNFGMHTDPHSTNLNLSCASFAAAQLKVTGGYLQKNGMKHHQHNTHNVMTDMLMPRERDAIDLASFLVHRPSKTRYGTTRPPARTKRTRIRFVHSIFHIPPIGASKSTKMS